jgi:hypothetical protein
LLQQELPELPQHKVSPSPEEHLLLAYTEITQ